MLLFITSLIEFEISWSKCNADTKQITSLLFLLGKKTCARGKHLVLVISFTKRKKNMRLWQHHMKQLFFLSVTETQSVYSVKSLKVQFVVFTGIVSSKTKHVFIVLFFSSCHKNPLESLLHINVHRNEFTLNLKLLVDVIMRQLNWVVFQQSSVIFNSVLWFQTPWLVCVSLLVHRLWPWLWEPLRLKQRDCWRTEKEETCPHLSLSMVCTQTFEVMALNFYHKYECIFGRITLRTYHI